MQITRYPGLANCYIVQNEKKNAVLIDPSGDPQGLYDYIVANELKIRYIFVTHGHYDSIMGVADIKRVTGALIVVSRDDCQMLGSRDLSLANMFGMEIRTTGPDLVADDGDVYRVDDMEFEFRITPGHTRGSAVILCGDNMFSGDTIQASDCGRCDLPGGDYIELLHTLVKLCNYEKNYTVYPGHGAATTLARERAENPHVLYAYEKFGSKTR